MKVIVTFGYNLEGTANDYSRHPAMSSMFLRSSKVLPIYDFDPSYPLFEGEWP